MYERKTYDEWQVQDFYDGAWEIVTYPSTRREAYEQLEYYNINERGIPHRVVMVRIPKQGEMSKPYTNNLVTRFEAEKEVVIETYQREDDEMWMTDISIIYPNGKDVLLNEFNSPEEALRCHDVMTHTLERVWHEHTSREVVENA